MGRGDCEGRFDMLAGCCLSRRRTRAFREGVGVQVGGVPAWRVLESERMWWYHRAVYAIFMHCTVLIC